MKKVLFILFNLLTVTAMAQTKGRFEVHDLGNYRLHVYYTNDALGDASYIIEGKDALVTSPNLANPWKNVSRTIMWEEREATMW